MRNIAEKEIAMGVDVPYSREVDYITFSIVLKDDRVVASYKMYWLLAILDEVQEGNIEIEFRKLVTRMIAYAWYPISKFRLYFGAWDNLGKVVNYISDTYNLKANINKGELIDFIYNSNDKELNKMIKNLTYNVPHKFLSQFYDGIAKEPPLKTVMILSKEHKRWIYEIYRNFNNTIMLAIIVGCAFVDFVGDMNLYDAEKMAEAIFRGVCRFYGVSVDRLVEMNGIEDRNRIYVGQEIII